jgi:hypothetical protein
MTVCPLDVCGQGTHIYCNSRAHEKLCDNFVSLKQQFILLSLPISIVLTVTWPLHFSASLIFCESACFENTFL